MNATNDMIVTASVQPPTAQDGNGSVNLGGAL